MDNNELIEAVKGVQAGVEEFKDTLKKEQKEHDALNEEKMAKITDEVTAIVEKGQEEARKAAAEEIAKAQRPVVGEKEEKAELQKKLSQEFNSFLKKGAGSDRADFADYLERSGKAEEFKSLSVGTDADGGFLVIPEFGGVVQTRAFEMSPVRQYATVSTIGTSSLEIVTDSDEAGSGWVAETATRPETDTPQLGKIVIETHELFANPRATVPALEDTVVDMGAWLSGKVAEKFAREEGTAFISGDGSGKPTGILNSVTDSTTYAGFSSTAIEQIHSGSAGAFTFAGLVDTQNSLKEVYQGNSIWMMKRAAFGEIMKLVDGDSRPLFNVAFDNAGVPGFTLLGRPVVFADDVPGAATDANALIYGDFRSGYHIVDRQGIRVLRDPYSAKPYIQFYTTKRVGGEVVNFEALKVNQLSA